MENGSTAYCTTIRIRSMEHGAWNKVENGNIPLDYSSLLPGVEVVESWAIGQHRRPSHVVHCEGKVIDAIWGKARENRERRLVLEKGDLEKYWRKGQDSKVATSNGGFVMKNVSAAMIARSLPTNHPVLSSGLFFST